MLDLVLTNEHYLGRLVAQIAHGAGVPMTLFRFEGSVELPGPELVNDGFKHFVDRLSQERPEGYNSWMSYLKTERDRIFASGRRNEHPFTTLLRSEPWWSVWELAVLWQVSLQKRARSAPQDVLLPGGLGELVQLKALPMPELSGLMVYGPVPRERGFSSPEIDRHIRRFDDAAQIAAHVPSPVRGGGYSSYERLRRMYFANGRTVDKLFATNVNRARRALELSLQANVSALRSEDQFDPALLPALDGVASVALTRVAHKGKQEIRFSGPASPGREIEIISQKDEPLMVQMAQAARAPDSEATAEESTGLELTSSDPDQEPSDTLQDVIAQAEDRNAQAMLQHFMLMRHWLNDRYARLSPMYNGDALAANDAARSLEEIIDWLLRLFDADFAAIYHLAGGGVLEEISFGSRSNPEATKAAVENSRHMHSLAKAPPAVRAQSSAYRALFRGTSEHVRDWDGAVSSTGISVSPTLEELKPRSTVAAPIIILGRTWGVIELVGFCANQFDKISSMWLEEASQLVGNALYQSWLLKQITQANLAVLVDREERCGDESSSDDSERNMALIARATRDKEARIWDVRNDICREMSELFISDAAALWLNNEQWPGRLQLRGLYGVPFDPRPALAGSPTQGEPVWPEIDIGTDDALAARLMRGEIADAGIFWEQLEPPVEKPTTARDAYRAALWKRGVRRVTLVPLLETSGAEGSRPIGALALYSMDADSDERAERYGRRWLPLVEFAGRHVAMLMRSIALESERQTSLELMFSHEVIGSLRRVKDQFHYLERNLLGPLARGRRPEALDSRDRIGDIDKAASRVKNGIGDAVERLEEMRREGFQMPSAGLFDFRSKSEWDNTPTVLFNAIQSAFNARYRFRVARKINWKITGTTEFIRIRLHPRDLETLFFNLTDNALKYATSGTDVRVIIDKRPTGNLYVDFVNEAPQLRPGEADRLFKLGFRGQLATNGDEDGSGQGLFITQRLAQTLGIGLGYDWFKIAGRTDVAHRFRLIFTKELVIYGRS